MSQFLNLNYTIVYKKILYPQRIHIINVIFYENAPIEYWIHDVAANTAETQQFHLSFPDYSFFWFIKETLIYVLILKDACSNCYFYW